jgi:hypothetical protein
VSASRRVIGALLLLVTCVGLTACGGTAAKTTAASSSSASAPAPASRPVPPVPSRTTPSATSHSKPASSHSSPTATSAALRHAFASFAACLSNNGVKLPAGTGSGSASPFSLKGVDTKSATYRRALQACIPVVNAALKAATGKHPGAASPSAPSTRPALPPVKVPAPVTAIMTRFTACMRSHGVPGFPEPKGASFNLTHTNIDSKSPQYKSAEARCTNILRALDPPG